MATSQFITFVANSLRRIYDILSCDLTKICAVNVPVKVYINNIKKSIVKKDKCVSIYKSQLRYYLEQANFLLKLNDSELRRFTIKELLLRYFSRFDKDINDSDLFISLNSIREISDTTLKHLCTYRLITNVIPSLQKLEDHNAITRVMSVTRSLGFLYPNEVHNLRRCGLIYNMEISEYYVADTNVYDSLQAYDIPISFLNDTFMLSNNFTPAGLLLTDILIEYYAQLHGEYKYWLPISYKSLHVKSMYVEKDIIAGNMIVRGDISSGGCGRN